MFFEGSEKKVELTINSTAASLRLMGRAAWEPIVALAGAKIISVVASDDMDAYLLSESSLFVSDRRAIIITCGATFLINAILALLDQIGVDQVESLIYERKHENFPHAQATSFFDDIERLRTVTSGQSMLFGDEDGHHLYLYHLDKKTVPEPGDTTLEILMHGIDDARGKDFCQQDEERLLQPFFGDFICDRHYFEPGGYSLNAVRGDEYIALHLTPEEIGSYVSLETNRILSDLDREILVAQVLNQFAPKSFDLALFDAKAVLPDESYGYALRKQVIQNLTCGYKVSYQSFSTALVETETARAIPIRKRESATLHDLWATEKFSDFLEIKYRAKRCLFSGRSNFQKVEVYETAEFGTMLLIDDMVMLSERDEWVYHDMIVHPAMFVHPGVRSALVIGGGDGGTVRELLRHDSVKHIDLVEIDRMVVDVCRKHIPVTAAALDDPRVAVTIADGLRHVAETDTRYDLVIVDSTDPVGPAEPLFGTQFYRDVYSVLNEGGICISQAESPWYEQKRQQSMLQILTELFEQTYIYNYNNITYPGGLWSFTFAVKGDLCPVTDEVQERITGSNKEFRYYNAATHGAAFDLPEFQQKALYKLLTPIKAG